MSGVNGEQGGGGSGGSRGSGGFRGGGRARGGAPPGGPPDELKLYVGGLSWGVDDAGLQAAFQTYGACQAMVMTDKYTGRSRGMGFVTFDNPAAATSAIEAMNGQEIDGRAITCNNARKMVERPLFVPPV